MKNQNFLKNNFSLIVGITLPIFLILIFLIASKSPTPLKSPPKYGFLFSVNETSSPGRLPVSLKLVVKDEKLYAQYLKLDNAANMYVSWKKLYYFDPETKKVKLISLGYPNDINTIQGLKEEMIEGTKNFKIDTHLTSPDGYSLSFNGHSRSGILSELFVGSRYNSIPRLKKDEDIIPLMAEDQNTYFYYGNIEHIGWVTGSHP